MLQRIANVLVLVLLALVAPALLGAQDSYDLLIRNARLLDGTGNPWYRADVAVQGDRIAAVGDLSGASATRVIDAGGLYVAPGFIDDHSHAGPGLETEELSGARPQLAQGITTVFVNPDGGGATDLRAQRSRLEEHGLGINVVQMVPHGSIRQEVIGMEDRPPTASELERMRGMVRSGMEAGAFGLSSGLFYAPGSYAGLDEVIELARVAGEYDGAYKSHIRDEADYNIGLLAAVQEVITVAEEAGVRGVVTHLKALGPRVWGFSSAIVHRIERARDRGVEIFADQYPYTASATGLAAALVPRWAQVGGHDSLVARMDDSAQRRRLREGMADGLDRRGGADRIQFRRYEPDPSVEGKTLAQVARERSADPLDTAMDLIREGDVGIVSFNMDPDDVERIMKQSWVMTCTDGDLVPMDEGVPHPRSYGAFPRKLRKYVVEDGVIDLGHAIRSMTGLPAAVFRMDDRGLVQAGHVADLVVFDLSEVRDVATFSDPHHYSRGMEYVLVNGELAIDGGEFTGALAGRVLSMPTARSSQED